MIRERVVRGDLSLTDWITAATLVNGTLRKETYARSIAPARGNVRELYAAARFESATERPVTFDFSGKAKRLWINGRLTPVDSTFTSEARAGVNTVVMQLDETTFPDAIRLRSEHVTFLTD